MNSNYQNWVGSLVYSSKVTNFIEAKWFGIVIEVQDWNLIGRTPFYRANVFDGKSGCKVWVDIDKLKIVA